MKKWYRLSLQISVVLILIFMACPALVQAGESKDGMTTGARTEGTTVAEEQTEGTAVAEKDAEEGATGEDSYLDAWMEEIDFTDLDDLLEEDIFPEQREPLKFSTLVQELLTDGVTDFDYTQIVSWMKDALVYELETNRKILVEVVVLAVGFSILKHFSDAFKQAYISEICFLLVYSIVAVLLLQSFQIYSSIADEVLSQSVDFMKSLVPTFCISMVFSAGVETSAGFYQMAFLVIYLIQWLFLKILMPLLHVYVLLELFNHFFEDEKFGNLTELIKGILNWGMKSAGVVVLGLNVVQGLISPAKDRLTNGSINKAAAVIPGIGDVLSGMGEVMLGAGILIKNCVGVAALLILIAIAMMPVLKILMLSLMYKLAAVVVEPAADKRIAGCLKGMAEGGMLYLKLVLYCVALLFVTVALTTMASGFAF